MTGNLVSLYSLTNESVLPMTSTQAFAVSTKFAAPKPRLGSRIVTTTLVAIACLGAVAAAWQLGSHRQAQAVVELQRLGGTIIWACRLDDMMQAKQAPDDQPPHWLLAGDSFVSGVYLMNCDDQQLDEKLASLKSLHGIRYLTLTNDNISDAALSHLSGLARLENLDLGNTRVTDAGLRSLATLQNLKFVNLEGTRVTPTGVALLRTQLPFARIVANFDLAVSAS